MEKIEKITLGIDGNYLLKQSMFGNKYTFDDDFGYIGGLETFFKITRRMIKDYSCNKVIVFWDGLNGGKYRHNIYPYYKSNRNKSWNDSELVLNDADIRKLNYLSKQKDQDAIELLQKLRIQQYCEELFIRQFEFENIESDDAIAYYAKHLKDPDERFIIYSNDGDMTQLVAHDDVWVYLANKKDVINKYNFNVLFYPYHHKNSALIKAIEGCTSDMVHGVSGVKEKTLLKHFPELRTEELTIDYILTKAKDLNERKKPLVALKNIVEGNTTVDVEPYLDGKHLIELNYKLVNLLEPETFMTEEAIEELEMYTKYAIDPEDRGGKNIIKLMIEDGFINLIPNKQDGVVEFLKQFLSIVATEKELFKQS